MASYKDLQSHIRNPTREEFSRHDEVMLKFRDAMWDIGQSRRELLLLSGRDRNGDGGREGYELADAEFGNSGLSNNHLGNGDIEGMG